MWVDMGRDWSGMGEGMGGYFGEDEMWVIGEEYFDGGERWVLHVPLSVFFESFIEMWKYWDKRYIVDWYYTIRVSNVLLYNH